ncbi:MAG: NAD(P)H-hydrate epimerase [Candidatus Omnitrophota bacterium]|nr:MAG: NAD(P)H-hydrate epimerase [Candidatus Omnitrophota bacterium]
MSENILSGDEALFLDRKAIYHIGIPRLILMENAGRNVAEFLESRTQERDKVVIFAGTGYNGGDALVCARHLFLKTRKIVVYMVGNLSKIKPETAIHLRILENLGMRVRNIERKVNPTRVRGDLTDAGFIVDGLLGTGAIGNLRPPIRDVVEILNSVNVRKVAIDIPTGVDCDSGQVLGVALKADYTVTFKGLKKGMLSPPGNKYCGKIFVTQIGG